MIFLNAYNLSSLIKEPTCYKNPENPSCIDLIITNSLWSFQDSLWSGVAVTIIKATFHRLPPKIRAYRNYNEYNNHKFRGTLVKELSLTNTWNGGIRSFIDICMRSLNNHASLKRKYIRGNHHPFYHLNEKNYWK